MPSPLINAARLVLKYKKSGMNVPWRVIEAARQINDGAITQDNQNTVLKYIGSVQTGATSFRQAAGSAGRAVRTVARYAGMAGQAAAGGAGGAAAGFSMGVSGIEDLKRVVESQGFKQWADSVGNGEGAVSPGRRVANMAAAGLRVAGAVASGVAAGGLGLDVGLNIGAITNGSANLDRQREMLTDYKLLMSDPYKSANQKRLGEARFYTERNRLRDWGAWPLVGTYFGNSASEKMGYSSKGIAALAIREALHNAGLPGSGVGKLFDEARERYFYKTYGAWGGVHKFFDDKIGGTWASTEGAALEAEAMLSKEKSLEEAGYTFLEHGQFGAARMRFIEASNYGGRNIVEPMRRLKGIIGMREDDAGWALSHMPRHSSSWE